MVGANQQLSNHISQFLLKNASALGIQYDLWREAGLLFGVAGDE